MNDLFDLLVHADVLTLLIFVSISQVINDRASQNKISKSGKQRWTSVNKTIIHHGFCLSSKNKSHG